jgi:alkylated DNA repair dioxygenase AlkB
MDLFSALESSEKTTLDLPQAEIIYYPSFFTSEEASKIFKLISEETPWRQDDIKLFGKTHKQPRLTALYGDEGKSYTYSGIEMHPSPFTPTILSIKKRIEAASGERYNSVLLNLYRDGKDSNGWHSDDEKELGINPHIASVTFGAKRMFHLRLKQNKKLKHSLQLEHGSLLLMGQDTQHFWQHQIPKSKVIQEPRINLTFRSII